MPAFLKLIPLKVWIGLGVLLIALGGWQAYKWEVHRREVAEAALAPAKASVEALNNVATQTEQIRSDTQEKEKAVDQIEGSQTRLPDGYGARLECVRRGERDCNP